MIYCKRCLYPANHPLNLTFDNEGVCSGCRVHEEKDVFDWENRTEKLKKILNQYRSKDRSAPDCIIPVSGARDSYYIVHLVKNVFKMHPLLVSYNKQYNTKIGIRNLAYLRSIFGCDFITNTVSPERVKRITRETLKLRGSMYWHCLAGQTVLPVQIAVKYKIPLIIWGAHQGVDQVGMYSHDDEVEMTRKYRKEHDLMGLEAEDLANLSDAVNLQDLEQYIYPHDKEIESVGVRGIYLNNYVRWDSKRQHEDMISGFYYESTTQQRTFDTYNDVDCFHYSGLHDYIKFLKYGYGKVTDHACREIRLRRMTREQGIELVSKYQNKPPQDVDIFLEWLKMSKDELWRHIDKHRDSRIWNYSEATGWELKDSILNHANDEGLDSVRLLTNDDCTFQLTDSKAPSEKEDKYILFGRGWVDNHPANKLATPE